MAVLLDRQAAASTRICAARRGRRCGLVLLIGALLAGAPGWANDLSGPSGSLREFEGRWRQVDAEKTDAARLVAIDRALAGASWVVRRMAAGRLKSTTVPPTDYEFTLEGDSGIIVDNIDCRVFAHPAIGVVPLTPPGEEPRLSASDMQLIGPHGLKH